MKAKWLRPSEALGRRFYHPSMDEKETESDEIQVVRRLGFRVGEIGLLIGENVISELTDLMPMCSIPNTASWMLGIANLRGNLFPVFDMAVLLGMEHNTQAKQMLLILGRGNSAAAIIIDGLPAQQIFVEADQMDNLPALPKGIRPYISAAYEKSGEMWFGFEHEGFFASLGDRVAT